MKKLALLLAVAIAAGLAGCGARDSGPSTAPPAATAPADTAPVPGSTSGAADLKQAAAATQESAGSEESAGDASLERIAAMPESAQLPGGRWKAGTHYRPIVPAQGTNAEPGQVEVLEILWLGCPHCYEMQPYIDGWKNRKPAYVKFAQEHVMWGPAHRAHAKLFYTLEVLGKDALVSKAFDEIHRHGNVLVAADDAKTRQMQLDFAKVNGISEADFLREYNSFAVSTRLQRAEELTRRYRVESVPTVIINGKYQTDVAMAGGHEQLIQLINDLAAAEKSH
jgi:thiol:disulfide interchange protein DsbA